ncbi:hypothetical protein QYZ88_016250 [Lachnospiraceae bacterium C1.1]|nr:hypothetical protein [Lachnospiraceae bacterium C1.1]
MNLRKVSIKSIYLFLMFLLPYADMINGYMIRQRGFYGIGSSFHTLLSILFVVVTLKKSNKGIFKKNLFLSIGTIILAITINFIMGEKIDSISIERIIKIEVTMLNFAALNYLMDSNRISKQEAIKIIYYQCIVILSITLISDITGTCNYAHWGNKGRMGLYSGTNEPVIILLTVMGFVLWLMHERSSFLDMLLFACGEVCLVMTESKAGMIMAAVYYAFFMYILYVRARNYSSIRNVILFMAGIIIIIIGIFFVYKFVVPSFIERQTRLMGVYIRSSGMTYLSSGRTLKITKLLIDPILRIFTMGGIIEYICAFLKLIVGQGAWFGYDDTVEMDFFDLLMYGGLIWGYIYIYNSAVVIRRVFIRQRNKLLLLTVLMVVIASFFVGHVWTGGYCGVYFALFCIFIKNYQPKKMK